jgi:hypothetical protein
MESQQGWQEQVRDIQEKANYSYSTEYLKGLIDNACELIQIMIRAGYTKQEINNIFGLGKERYGKKERALLNAMVNGRVNPTDSLATIQEKMSSEMKLSRQSWAIAFRRLIENGDLG